MAYRLKKAVTVWKKALGENGDVIVKLRLPKNTLVRQKVDRCTGKNRASRAKVLAIENRAGRRLESPGDVCSGGYRGGSVNYVVGAMVHAKGFDHYEFEMCAAGIHFFRKRWAAVKYQL